MSVTWHSVLLCEVLLMVAQSCGRRLPPPMIADVKPVSQAAPENPHVTQTEKYFQAEKYFEEGLRLEIAGQYDRALEALEQSVAAGNDYYPAWLHLGRVNLLRDRRAAALMYLEVAVGLRPNDPGALYWRAEANLQLGETRDAIADYGRALQQKKDGLQRSEIYASRAEAYSRLGQGAEALEDYSHAIRWQPGAASAHYRRGLLYRKLGQLQAAMQDFGVALSLRPNYEEARLAQRSVNEMLSPPPKEAAIATIQPTVVQPIAAPPIAAPPIAAPPAVTNKPAAATPEVPPKAVRPAENLYGTARKLIQARREHEAIGELNEALGLKPGYPEALNARGFAWLLLRKYPRAIADFDAALRLRPDYPNTAHNRKVAVAAASGTSPIQAQSSPAESLWRAARELIQSGQYHDAVKKLDTAIDLKPKYAQAFNARGFAWLLLRQYERALGDFDRALQILPDYPNALHNRQATLKAAAAAILHAGK